MNTQNDKSITSENAEISTQNAMEAAAAEGKLTEDPGTLQSAYEHVLPFAKALESKDLATLNLDSSVVCTSVVAVARRLAKRRSFFASLPDFDMTSFDGLETSGNALFLAQSRYRAAITPPDELGKLIIRGSELRGLYQRAGESVADAGLLSKQQALAMRGGTSYRDLAEALTGWVEIFRAGPWPQIRANSILRDEMLVEGQAIAQEIVAIVGDHSMSPERVAEVADLRNRMFTVCMKRYEDVRRGVTYMRWFEDDAEVFAPSLYTKGSRHSDAKEQEPVTPVVAAPPGKRGAGR